MLRKLGQNSWVWKWRLVGKLCWVFCFLRPEEFSQFKPFPLKEIHLFVELCRRNKPGLCMQETGCLWHLLPEPTGPHAAWPGFGVQLPSEELLSSIPGQTSTGSPFGYTFRWSVSDKSLNQEERSGKSILIKNKFKKKKTSTTHFNFLSILAPSCKWNRNWQAKHWFTATFQGQS